MKTRQFVAGLVSLAASILASPDDARAIPRYSARYEQTCNLCHLNPSGGGLRSTYAMQYLAPTELVARPYTPEQLERIEPNVSKSVTVGADFRTMVHYSEDHREYPNFFQMQGDFYVQFQADEKISLYLDRGMTRSSELFALGYVLPWAGYVKVGRFSPPLGWRFDDHTAFVRTRLSLAPPTDTDTGAEIGLSPGGHLSFQAALLNGALGSNSDDDERFSQAISVVHRHHMLGLGMAHGFSYWHNQTPAGTRSSGGPFGYLKWRQWIWVAELDLSRVELPDALPHTELATSHELSYEARQGVYLRGTFDLFDPTIDDRTGSVTRVGIGLDALPMPWVGIKAMYNIFRLEDPERGTAPDATLGQEYEQIAVQLHLYY